MSDTDRRVLVTGAGGFIGRHALRPLRERGFDVHAVDVVADVHLPDGIHRHQADLFNPLETRRLMCEIRPTHLLHLAWFVKHGDFWRSPENLRWVQASLDLYQGFQAEGGRRMVTAGTCAEYDWGHSELVEGKTPLHPTTLYGACKDGLRTVAEAFATETGLTSAWGRVFLLYGPWENPKRLIAGAIRSLLLDQPFPCSHGRQIRDFMHVQDVADAFAALVDHPLEGAVNIASGEPAPIADVLQAIGRLLDREDLIQLDARPAAPDDPPALRASVNRLRDELGWAPAYSLQEGLADTIGWWRKELNKEG